jgi:hypothetical protein
MIVVEKVAGTILHPEEGATGGPPSRAHGRYMSSVSEMATNRLGGVGGVAAAARATYLAVVR